MINAPAFLFVHCKMTHGGSDSSYYEVVGFSTIPTVSPDRPALSCHQQWFDGATTLPYYQGLEWQNKSYRTGTIYRLTCTGNPNWYRGSRTGPRITDSNTVQL